MTKDQLRISIVDSTGLTYIGWCSLNEAKSNWMTIREARCIICWGTSSHLAELVNGAMDDTKLGYKADVEVRRDNVVCSYLVNVEAWEKSLLGKELDEISDNV